MRAELRFSTCFEVDDELLDSAFGAAGDPATGAPRDRAFALLERMARIVEPKQGGQRILLVLARLAQSPWLRGDLRAEFTVDGQATHLALFSIGEKGNKSVLHPVLRLNMPIEEIVRFASAKGALIMPLEMDRVDADQISFQVNVEQHSGRRTARMKAVRIPRSAYRSDPPPDFATERPPPPESEERPTIAPAPPPPPTVKAPEVSTDDVDDGWD